MAKPKSYVLTKPIDGVFSTDEDGERWITFQAEDIGITYTDDNPGVARAVALHPGCFQAQK